ncbi:MAG: hypothetical protein AB1521_14045 [Bacteroidota bacterium]
MFVENIDTISLNEFISLKYKDTIQSNGSKILSYTGTNDEYNYLRYGVGIHLNNCSLIIELLGNDVIDFLHRVSTNSINDVKPFYKRNTLFLNEKGRFIDRAIYINFGDSHFLVGHTDADNRLLNWVNRYIISEDIKTKDISGNYLLLDFIGPQAESFLTLIVGDELKSLNGENIIKCIVDGFEFFVFSQHEPFGNKYYKVLISSTFSAKFLAYLEDNRSVFDFGLVGEKAFKKFRIESGMPVFPNEINDNYNPHDTNLLSEVNFKKGCYIGQEVIARLDTYDKVQNKMVKVEINSTEEIIEPLVITNDAKEEIGEITSIYKCDAGDKYIGLAVIKKKFLINDFKLFVETNAVRIPISYQDIQNFK